MSSVSLFIGGAIAGAAVAFLVAWATSARLKERLENLQSEVTKDQEQIQSLNSEIHSEREIAGNLRAELERIKTVAEKDRESFQRQLDLVDTAETKFKDAFKALASEALRGNNAEFLNLAQAKLGEQQVAASGDLDLRKQAVESLVQPISETLLKLENQIQQLEVKREGAYGGITEQITMLTSQQQELRTETARLVGALKTPIHRGRWGEVQLKRVVELAGMLEHCDFEQQQSYDTEDGKLRPDMIVNLPNRRQIVVDSKVSLAAYLEAMACDDDSQRGIKLKEHAAQVKAHLTRLSSKSYWTQLPCTPEFVVAFLPGEVFFSAALQQDPSLIEFGAEQRVVLATPTTLIALLKAVAFGWRQERLAENAEEISILGKSLYERLADLTEHLVSLRKNLDASVKAFNRTVGTLESRVIVSARKFRELGAAGGDDIAAIEPIETSARELVERKDPALNGPVNIKRIAAAAGDDGTDS